MPGLSSALTGLRDALARVRLTVPLPDAAAPKIWVADSIHQLDDYILPRLASIEAPLLAVVGGSTGAGKSTLVNSLLGHVVTMPGVIRPTTHAPVLVHNPDDEQWFNSDRVLPGLSRSLISTSNPRSIHIVSSPAVPQGLAILDAPDIDSVDVDNRVLAGQLLAAADLWLFITSAARYADAVPWGYLAQAAERSAAVAVVVDRIPPAAMNPVPAHLAQMMTDRGLGDSPLFAVPETITDDQGLLPARAVEPIKEWLVDLAASKLTRARIVMQTLRGSMEALVSGVGPIASAVASQTAAVSQLRSDIDSIYSEVIQSVRTRSSDGTLLRGEVMARWQDFVGTGDFMRAIQSRMGRLRDRFALLFTGDSNKADDVQVAVKSGLETLIIEGGEAAASRVYASWMAQPAGRYLIERTGVDVSTVPSDFPAMVEHAIRLWQQDVFKLVETEGAGKRTKARLAALGVNAVGVALMLVAFAHTGGLAGAEIGIAGGTAVVAQKVLELVFGDEVIRRMAATTEQYLAARITEVLIAEHDRLIAATLSRMPAELVTSTDLNQLAADCKQAIEAEDTRLDTLFFDDQVPDHVS